MRYTLADGVTFQSTTDRFTFGALFLIIIQNTP